MFETVPCIRTRSAVDGLSCGWTDRTVVRLTGVAEGYYLLGVKATYHIHIVIAGTRLITKPT